MIDRTYRCDLCRKMMEAPVGDWNGIGIRWANLGRGRETMERTDPRQVEHHICTECLDDLRVILAKQEARP